MIIRKAVEFYNFYGFFNAYSRKFLSEKSRKKSSAVALLFLREN